MSNQTARGSDVDEANIVLEAAKGLETRWTRGLSFSIICGPQLRVATAVGHTMLTSAQEKLLDRFASFFDDEGWRYQRVDDSGYLRMGFAGRQGRWQCFAQVRESAGQLLFYSVLVDHTPDDRRYAMAEMITRINYGLPIGNFEMDFDDGELRFKTQLDVDGAAERLSTEMLRNIVVANVLTVDRYYEVIERAMNSDENPAMLVKIVEGPPLN